MREPFGNKRRKRSGLLIASWVAATVAAGIGVGPALNGRAVNAQEAQTVQEADLARGDGAAWTRFPDEPLEWRMNGNDVGNSRSQPAESAIDSHNVRRLKPRWVLSTREAVPETGQTAGDISATPAVVVDDDDYGYNNRGPRRKHRSVYFPDWAGQLWRLDAETGKVWWSRAISEYNGIANAISRTSPAYANGTVFIGDLNGNMMAVDAKTGDLVWITELDPNPNTIVTTSPVVLGNRLYIATSSSGSGVPRQIFRGSMVALDIRTGKIVWQTFVLPDNGGVPGGFAGGAFVNPPAIDLENGTVVAAAGQLYNQPQEVTDCLAAAPDQWDDACFPDGAYFNAVVAFDLRTGKPRWSFRGAGPKARLLGCGEAPPAWCAPWQSFSVWDFAGSGANVFRARIKGRWRGVVGIGQKSGVYWALDARSGELLWSRLVGHGDDPGGIQWGTAVDGKRIYAAIGHNANAVPYTLPSGETITGGSWAALDPATGRVLWQTADLLGAPDLAALTVANGVLYGGSMAKTGDQMYAISAATGKILWTFEAGGSVVAGPAIVDGTVYWGSGYARTGGVGNNKFFAFSIDGR